MRPAVIVALAAAAIAAVAGCKRSEKRGAADAPAIVIDDRELWPRVAPDHVTGITIERTGAAPVVLARGADGWRLEAPIADRADPRAVQFALEELRQLEWDPEPLTRQRAEWSRYQIDPDQAVTVTVREGAITRPALILGKKKVARIGRRHDVQRIHNLSYYTFARELRFWRDRAVTRMAPDELTGLTVRHGDDTLVLRRAAAAAGANPAAAWTVERGGEINLDRAARIHRRLLDLEARDVAAVSVDDAGLAEPRASLIAHRAAGDLRLDLGGQAPEGGVYVRVSGGDRVLILDRAASQLLAAPIAAWR